MGRLQLLVCASMAVPIAASLVSWLPTSADVWRDLSYTETAEKAIADTRLSSFKGMKFSWKPVNLETHWFNAAFWPGWTSRNWAIPLTAVVLYFIIIPTLRHRVSTGGKFNVRNFAFYWNAGLSIFSWCGVFSCVPVLVGSLYEHGLYFTCCAHATWYGAGLSGFFVMLFVYSKLAELIDTVLLLMADKPVIALQWWHHSTVLLYCWHSYSTRIATGLWFAAMNYSVHSIMYGYFALMSTPYRKYITPYAIFITLAQLLQMLVGMFVTIKAVMYQVDGHTCMVNKTNSVLGLLMYFSYFILFFKLFVDNYVTQSRKRSDVGLPPKQKTLAQVTRDMSRRLTSTVLPQLDLDTDDEDEDDEGAKKDN